MPVWAHCAKMTQPRVVGDPTNALIIPFQNPILDHVTPDGCGVTVEFGDDRVEELFDLLSHGVNIKLRVRFNHR